MDTTSPGYILLILVSLSAGLALGVLRVARSRFLRRAPLPYGCMIAGAALIVLLGPTGPLRK